MEWLPPTLDRKSVGGGVASKTDFPDTWLCQDEVDRIFVQRQLRLRPALLLHGESPPKLPDLRV